MGEGLKSSGVPSRLTGTVRPSGKAQPNAIPKQADKETIVPMQELAEDATTAGAEGDPTSPVTSNGALDKALPGFSGLIAPRGSNVP